MIPHHHPAKRGMVVVHVVECRDWISGQPNREYTEVHVGVATSITRDGVVKRYRRFGWSDLTIEGPASARFRGQLLAVPNVDPAGAEAATRAHFYPGHPNQVRAFADLAETREALRPYRTDLPDPTRWHVRRRKADEPAPDGWKYSKTFATRKAAQREADAWNGAGDFAQHGSCGWTAEVIGGPAPKTARSRPEQEHTR